MKRKNYRKVTERDFNQLKALLGAGVTARQVTQITGRSSGTIGYVRKANTFQEYRDLVTSYLLDLQKRKDSKKVEDFTNDFLEKVESQKPLVKYEEVTDIDGSELIRALTEINDTLKQLVEAWNKPQKRGLFN